ncbi:MAG: tetratricopeptide repeat protein [Proteobacteria bacterium]|nr:tetratricopeptide repeat protein [Pseudomonadota bacterium]
MKKCPECGLTISEKDKTQCSSCGYVFTKPTSKKRLFLTIIIVLATSIILLAYLANQTRLSYWVYNITSNIKNLTQISGTQYTIPTAKQKDIYHEFLDRYTVRPDTRFINSFKILAKLYGKYRNLSENDPAFSIGNVIHDGKMASIPVIKDENVVTTIALTADMTFADVLQTLDQCLSKIDEGNLRVTANPQRGIYWMSEYEAAISNFHRIDPRRIIEGLSDIERLWQKEGPDSRLLLAAAKGYALLYMSLYPDRMQYADDFASYSLGFLALARHVDPGISSFREEALIAMNMGYTAHADRLLKSSFDKPDEPTDKIIDAYMKKDFKVLQDLQGDGSNVLSYYLLARLYRESGLYREAEEMTKGLLKRIPDHYPTIMEAIYSSDLSVAKILTILYPLDILADMEQKVSPGTLKIRKKWSERINAFAGDPSTGSSTSIQQFENLLSNWHLPDGNEGYGFFINEQQIKNIYKSLYSGAVYLRFKILLNRWNTVDKAENYVRAISEGDETSLVAMIMLAEANNELGNFEQVKSICEKIVNHPETSASLAMKAYLCVDDYQVKLKFAPAIFKKLDGRPVNLTRMGRVFQQIYNYDMAGDFYSLALKKDPFYFSNYQSLAKVAGTHVPITCNLENFSYNFLFLEKAGDYLARHEEPVYKIKALDCYDKALKLAPSRNRLWKQKAKILQNLKRYEESAEVLKKWLKKYGRNDLVTTIYKSKLANIYLDMGKPKIAFKVLSDEIDSYQGGFMMSLARTYEDLKKPEEAEKIYHKALTRYPTGSHILSGAAAFMWRFGRDKEAAEYIEKGRLLNGKFSRWYFDDYMKIFSQATEERIMKAFDHIAAGAGVWEISSLAFYFEKVKRPEIAYWLLTKVKAATRMQQLENTVNIYKVLRKWKGVDQAGKFLAPNLTPQSMGPLSMILFKEGQFDLILTELKNPNDYQEDFREFMWLMKLMAWQACNQPEQDLPEFTRHYENNSPDYYHSIGKYMMGLISRSDLLRLIKSPKQRCEFLYYIGFSERMKGNFREAANWYQICLETGLSNNGEYHWASDELFWWAHMGTTNRHKKVSDDISAYLNRLL